ncbi:ImmA/IrrE family metallo-endopeptidase [uncultured Leuconostoc sp.]|uniref:ImmA/IrrE family metallo-endopeptidase n=1 Tax=uncultured Leuconostoc sp. TaxID=173262 RepID=UPI00258F2155|nr:ImmA/IrrE family metallo-endopeptidase [uncultured Leuconostoc sp.]
MTDALSVQKSFLFKETIEVLEFTMQANNVKLIVVHGTTFDADLSNKSKRTVIINPNFNTTFSLPFRIAHELAHVLYGENSKTYLFSPLSKKTEETNANLLGIKLLSDIFFSEYTSNTQRWENRFNFIEVFDLHPLTHLVERVLLENTQISS